jgi:hypothetical protein
MLVLLFAVSLFFCIYNIYYYVNIYLNFPKGTWIKTMENPVYDGETLCAYLYRKNHRYLRYSKKIKWSCIDAKIDTILHNIDGNFVYDCKQNPKLCKEALQYEMHKFFIMDD